MRRPSAAANHNKDEPLLSKTSKESFRYSLDSLRREIMMSEGSLRIPSLSLDLFSIDRRYSAYFNVSLYLFIKQFVR